MSGWSLSPLVLGGGAFVLMQFGRAFTRLRRRGRHDYAGWDRAVLFLAGVTLSVVPLVSPLAGSSLSGHMAEHLLIGDLAPALLLLALRGPLLFFVLPACASRLVAHNERLRTLAGICGRPSVALAAWAGAYAVWHVPAAYDLAAGHELAHGIEHLSFVTVGMLVWMQLIDPASRRALGTGGRMAFAGALFALGQVLSNVFFLAPQPLFSAYAGNAGALGDQQLAGVLMMAEQLLTLGVCAGLLLRSRLQTTLHATPAPA